MTGACAPGRGEGAAAIDEVGRGSTVDYRVRFDECGPDGLARSSAYLRWAQDLAWIDSERLGYDRGWYAARGITWLVRSISLEILDPLVSGETIALSTRVTGLRRVWARRRTELVRGSAEEVATAPVVARLLTDWVMIDARGAPTRVPDEFAERFSVPPEPFEPVRVPEAAPPPGASDGSIVVRPHEIDPLGHANHAVYADWVDEAAGAAGMAPTGPRRYLLEYLFPATVGERLSVVAWSEDGSVACAIAGPGEGARAGRLRARVEAIGGSVPGPNRPPAPAGA